MTVVIFVIAAVVLLGIVALWFGIGTAAAKTREGDGTGAGTRGRTGR